MKRVYLISFVLLTIASCAGVDEYVNPLEESVGITATIGGPDSRVSEDGKSFLQGDIIKVENLSRTTNNIAEFTYNQGTGSWVTADLLYWQGLEDNNFTAWYPASASYEQFTVPASQAEGTGLCDWMTSDAVAKKEDGSVILSFAHHLSKVTVSIDAWGDEFEAEERSIENLSVLSLSTLMQNDGSTITGDGQQQFVQTSVLEADSRFSAILAPGTYASETEIIKITIGEKILSVKTSEVITIKPANAYIFSLTVGKDEMTLSKEGVSVGEWTAEDLGSVELETGVLELSPEAVQDIAVSYGGGNISIPLNTNVDYETSVAYASGEEEWVQVLDGNTKAAETALNLRLLPNKTDVTRSAVLSIFNILLNVRIEITLSQPPFTGLDDTGFNGNKYLEYALNHYSESSGGVYDTDIYSYCTYFTTHGAVGQKWEFKFQLTSAPGTFSEYILFSEYVGRDNTDEVCLCSYGLRGQGTSYKWADLGVTETDVITMIFDKGNSTLTVNGKSLSCTTSIGVEYLFSSYYYDRDDGVYRAYSGFQDGAKLYYVKGWDAEGRLVYIGTPSMEQNSSGILEACWVANYYAADGTTGTSKTFSYKGGDDKDPFGSGNL